MHQAVLLAADVSSIAVLGVAHQILDVELAVPMPAQFTELSSGEYPS